MSDLFTEPMLVVSCKCSNNKYTTLDVDSIYYEEYGNTKVIVVKPHR